MEDLLLWQTVGLGGCLEPLDVLHELEVGAFGLDLLDGTRGEFVHEVAEDDAISENVVEVARGYRLSQTGEDPVQDFGFEFLVAFLGKNRLVEVGKILCIVW